MDAMDDSLSAIATQVRLSPLVGRFAHNQQMEDKVVDTFASRIRTAREARGLTLEAVSEHCGLEGHAAVANWENQRNYPQLDNLVYAAELYGVSIDYLCWGGQMGGIDAKVRKVPEVLRPGLIDRLNKEIEETMKATERLPKEMLGATVGDTDTRLKAWSAKNAPKGPKRTPSKTKRHSN